MLKFVMFCPAASNMEKYFDSGYIIYYKLNVSAVYFFLKFFSVPPKVLCDPAFIFSASYCAFRLKI